MFIMFIMFINIIKFAGCVHRVLTFVDGRLVCCEPRPPKLNYTREGVSTRHQQSRLLAKHLA